MRRNLLKNGSAISAIVIAVIVVIIVVAGAVGAYYAMQPGPEATPTPTATPTATPASSESPTEAPTQSPGASPTAAPSESLVANFKNGAYASYNETQTVDGVTTSMNLNFTIGEETYDGTPCWTLTTTAGNESYSIVIFERISQSNTSQIVGNATMKMYQDGTLFYEQEFDPSTDSVSGMGTTEITQNMIVGTETVTVPAGTFTNCQKATYDATDPTTGDATVVTVWMDQNVPAFGMVKAVETLNGATLSTLELIDYGGYP